MQLALETGIAVYLVGGPVRDALLGARVLDLDFAVEGDAPAFARRLSERLNGRSLSTSASGLRRSPRMGFGQIL